MQTQTKSEKLKIGFDFDGVIAYNPLRIIRPLMSFLKLKKIVKRDQLVFFQPKNNFQELCWWLAHQSSFVPNSGLDLLRGKVESRKIEAHLLTGRTPSLKKDLFFKLRLFKVLNLFKTISITNLNEQPHLFKARMIKQLNLDFFIEDNYDIVCYLSKPSCKTKIIWLTNSLDKHIQYQYKYLSLPEALSDILTKKI